MCISVVSLSIFSPVGRAPRESILNASSFADSCLPSLLPPSSAALLSLQDVGHSKQARAMLAKYYIGEYAGGPSEKPKAVKGVTRCGRAPPGPRAAL